MYVHVYFGAVEILDADVVTVGTATGSTSTMGIATGSTSTVGTATGSTSTVGTATGSTSTVGMATGSTSTVGTATDSTSTVSMSTGSTSTVGTATGSTSTVGTATSSTTARSPFSELLVYPTPTQRKSKPKSCARVLTSAKSIAMLEEKARKKQEEIDLKDKKKERQRKFFEMKKRSAKCRIESRRRLKSKEGWTKETILDQKGKTHHHTVREQRNGNEKTIVLKVVFSIVRFQRMNVLFALGCTKRTQNKSSG